MLVVGADDLDQVVVAAGAGDQVGDLVELRQRLAGGLPVGQLDGQPEQAHDLEAELSGR